VIPICSGAWHRGCYTKDPLDKYPVLQAKDLEDSLMDTDDLVDEDPTRYQEARDGDHLMCPFQCDICHFANIHHCSPNTLSAQDNLCMVIIRRANLDALWARERATVEANRREALIFVREGMLLGFTNPYPSRGPWPIDDIWGMKTAMVILQRSLCSGKNARFVQYETIRKTRSHMSNFVHTVPGGMGEMFIASESNVSGMTRSPTNSLWFKRFMQGCHRRMGDVWCPDRPLTMREALAIQEDLENDWLDFARDPQGRLRTAVAGVMVTAGLGGGMRGEELNRLDIGIIRKHWKEAINHQEMAHVPLGMVGRFKRTVGEKMYIQPLAIKSKSGLEYRLWMFRMLSQYAAVGIASGPVFRRSARRQTDKVERARVGDINLILHPALARVQARQPNLIGEDTKVEEEYSASRSFKRGATAQARNMDIPKDVIEANNRWRQKERSRGSTPHMSLLERYTDAKASVPLLVKFSAGL
jgi:hypothetical protein